MFNVLLAGVGGQGTVLAAKVLAQAAQSKGWKVRTAETIGMAQRGGTVLSHVRMGNQGEEVYSSLISAGEAQIIIAFEPAEAARAFSYAAPGATVITAKSSVQPVTAALSGGSYSAETVLAELKIAVEEMQGTLLVVEDESLCAQMKTRKVLNTLLLAYATANGALPLSLEELKEALAACVKPAFVDMNIAAVDLVAE